MEYMYGVTLPCRGCGGATNLRIQMLDRSKTLVAEFRRLSSYLFCQCDLLNRLLAT